MTTSIIVPTLNEAPLIADTLAHIKAVWPEAERIVADGGSTDGTVALAQRSAHVVPCARGRGAQCSGGADASTADLLVFLHADSRLPPDAAQIILGAVGSGAEAGAFRLRFDPSTGFLRLLALTTRLDWPSICFGDRGLFVTRKAYREIGGFADLPIFEDADMARRLHARGRFVFLDQFVSTSPRRFEQRGAVRQQLLNTTLWLAWRVGVSPRRLAGFYHYRP